MLLFRCGRHRKSHEVSTYGGSGEARLFLKSLTVFAWPALSCTPAVFTSY